jgi:prefoldin alpha subunit
MEKKEVERKIMEYRILEQNRQAMIERRDEMFSRFIEVRGTIESVEEMEKNSSKEFLLPMGSGVLVPVNVDSKKKMVIGIGSDLVIEKNINGIKEELKKRAEMFSKGIEAVERQISAFEKKMAELGAELNAEAK